MPCLLSPPVMQEKRGFYISGQTHTVTCIHHAIRYLHVQGKYIHVACHNYHCYHYSTIDSESDSEEDDTQDDDPFSPEIEKFPNNSRHPFDPANLPLSAGNLTFWGHNYSPPFSTSSSTSPPTKDSH